jgi:hypothetical protein
VREVIGLAVAVSAKLHDHDAYLRQVRTEMEPIAGAVGLLRVALARALARNRACSTSVTETRTC